MGSTDSRNSEDNIYDVLRTDILNLKLRPGMIFSIRDISEAYQVGRTPVRDALISLSKEGLITFLPQRGTMISKINYDKVLNERFLRTCVEEKVILEFMAVCDLKAITELEMSLDRQEKFVEEEDIRAFLAEDMYFHSIFYVGVNKGYCNDIISANSGHYMRIRLLAMADQGIDREALKQHKEITDAILAKDWERLHTILNFHLNRLVNQERALLSKYPDLFERENVEEGSRTSWAWISWWRQNLNIMRKKGLSRLHFNCCRESPFEVTCMYFTRFPTCSEVPGSLR